MLAGKEGREDPSGHHVLGPREDGPAPTHLLGQCPPQVAVGGEGGCVRAPVSQGLRRLWGESVGMAGGNCMKHRHLHAAAVGLLWTRGQEADCGCGLAPLYPPGGPWGEEWDTGAGWGQHGGVVGFLEVGLAVAGQPGRGLGRGMGE